MKYALLTLALFLTEVLIALLVKDSFFRPFFGDFLATILVYTSLRMVFSKRSIFEIAVISLLISYLVELLQYFNFVHITGLSKYKALSIILGTSFSWLDMVAYTAGFIFVLICESYAQKNLKPTFQ